jgi:1-phosphatidylinositol-5-phosphate 4-kinase
VKDGDGHGVGLLLTSYDRTLKLKQISSEEVEDMHNILSEYHQVTTLTPYSHLATYSL